MSSRFSLVAAVLLSLTPSITSGQTLKVRCLTLRSGEMPEVYLKGSEEQQLLGFSSIQPTPALEGLSANPLPLYKSVVDKQDKQSFVVAHKVKIPAGSDAILLLGWMAQEKPHFVAIKDNFTSARYDDWLLINTTTKPIAFKVGDKAKPVQVAPGTSKTYKIKVDKDKGTAVQAVAPIEGKAKTIYSTYWPVRADKRAIVLFVDDGKRIRVKRISDQVGPKTSSQK